MWVSILGLLEGVLNDERTVQSSGRRQVSILGLLEGVLNEEDPWRLNFTQASFNPWFVGGGVKCVK